MKDGIRKDGHPVKKRGTSARMLAALEAYQATDKTLNEVCEIYGVTRRGIGPHITAMGINRYNWKRGYTFNNGYITVSAPLHPFPRKGGMVKEHLRIMELRLGRRLLPGECCHHKDLNRLNNADDNLVLMSPGEHSRLHRLIEASLGHIRRDRSAAGGDKQEPGQGETWPGRRGRGND